MSRDFFFLAHANAKKRNANTKKRNANTSGFNDLSAYTSDDAGVATRSLAIERFCSIFYLESSMGPYSERANQSALESQEMMRFARTISYE